jgi:hypothetical protein
MLTRRQILKIKIDVVFTYIKTLNESIFFQYLKKKNNHQQEIKHKKQKKDNWKRSGIRAIVKLELCPKETNAPTDNIYMVYSEKINKGP